jgi:tetratricopeptide (TPR) repeat protein
VAGIIISAIGFGLLGLSLIVTAFLMIIPLRSMGCGGTTSATDQPGKEIASYQAAVKADPKNVEAWRSLGENYLLRANQETTASAAQQVDRTAAATSYEKAAKLLGKQKGKAARQEQLDTLVQLARVYLFQKDYQMATSTYGRITALRPKDAQSFFDMATVAISAGDTKTALFAFRMFLELDPTSPDATPVRAWIKANSPKASPSPAP